MEEEKGDFPLPPPPGQRTPPLILDDFLSRPLTQSIPMHPAPTSLEDFLSLPPITTSNQSVSVFSSPPPVAVPLSSSFGGSTPQLFSGTIPVGLPPPTTFFYPAPFSHQTPSALPADPNVSCTSFFTQQPQQLFTIPHDTSQSASFSSPFSPTASGTLTPVPSMPSPSPFSPQPNPNPFNPFSL